MKPAERHDRHPPQVQIEQRAAQAVRHGHPWVWRNAIRTSVQLPCGTAVEVVDNEGKHVARGLWDPDSPIAVRIYTRAVDQHLDLPLLTNLVTRAIDARSHIFDRAETNAFRLCNGEGDRVPGVVLDRYDRVAVAKFDGSAIQTWGDALLGALWPHLRDLRITTLLLRESRRGQPVVRVIAGPEVREPIVVVEHGMRMLVDVMRGQKTGAFLDQRENRLRVRAMAQGARVLNLFSYTGGFSCAAALGGAQHVTSVDIAHPAHALAQETFRLNGLDPSVHSFVTADVQAFVDQAVQRSEHYQLVISDPPSFAPSERSLPKALQAYKKLHEACAKVVARGGVLCAASCSSHVTMEAFAATLDDSVFGNRAFVLNDAFGQPSDHPSLPAWPEGRYLKFLVLRETSPALHVGAHSRP